MGKLIHNTPILYYVILFIIGALLGVHYIETPLMVDDLWYLHDANGILGTWQYFKSMLTVGLNHWNFDVGRLTCIAATPFLSLFPKYVYGIVTSAIMIYIIEGGRRLAELKPFSIYNALWILGIVFVYPWLDYQFSIIFSINYIWGIGLGVGFISLLKFNFNYSCTLPKAALLLIFGIIVGWWHEGFTAPLLSSVAMFYIIIKKRPSKSNLLLILGLIIGFVLLFSMPAFQSNTSTREMFLWIKPNVKETLMHLIAFNLFGWIILITSCIVFCVPRWRRYFNSRLHTKGIFVASFTFSLISSLIYTIYYNGPRTGAYNQMFSLLALLYLMHTTIRKFNLRNLNIAFYSTAMIISIISLTCSATVQYKISNEFRTVMSIKQSNPYGEVYFDPTPIKFGIDFLRPTYFALNSGFGNLNILPLQLKGFSPDSPKTAIQPSGIMIYNNCIIVSTTQLETDAGTERFDIEIEDNQGTFYISRASFRVFHSGKKKYLYIIPNIQHLKPELIIKNARIISIQQ